MLKLFLIGLLCNNIYIDFFHKKIKKLTREMRVIYPTHCTALELHLVFCQSASFVRKNVLYLSKILIDVKGPALHSPVRLLIIQLFILYDKKHLAQFHHLHRYIQWQWNDRLQNTNVQPQPKYLF